MEKRGEGVASDRVKGKSEIVATVNQETVSGMVYTRVECGPCLAFHGVLFSRTRR